MGVDRVVRADGRRRADRACALPAAPAPRARTDAAPGTFLDGAARRLRRRPSGAGVRCHDPARGRDRGPDPARRPPRPAHPWDAHGCRGLPEHNFQVKIVDGVARVIGAVTLAAAAAITAAAVGTPQLESHAPRPPRLGSRVRLPRPRSRVHELGAAAGARRTCRGNAGADRGRRPDRSARRAAPDERTCAGSECGRFEAPAAA